MVDIWGGTRDPFELFQAKPIHIASESSVRDLEAVFTKPLVNHLQAVANVQRRVDVCPCPADFGYWLVWALGQQRLETGPRCRFELRVLRHACHNLPSRR